VTVRARRPNFLVVMADQLAAGWLPAYGQAAVHAPSLTALAESAVTFEAAYCPSPLCAPSRAAMLSGRHASRIGVFDNAAELPASVPTIAHHLRAAGYRTCLAGKMHFVGPDQLHGFERRLTTDIYPAGLDWTPDWTRSVADRLPWYHSMESVLTPARTLASMQTDYDDEVAFQAVRHVHELARDGDERPFLLTVSFTSPHDPWEIPPRYWDLYDPELIALPTVPRQPPELADPHSRRLREMAGIDGVELTEAQLRHARHAYFAAISYLDERVGAVLDAVRESGLDAGTWIVFTADHGELLGERGLWYKMSFLEPSARVPLIVRPTGGPGGAPVRTGGPTGRELGWRPGRRVAQPVSLLDLAPTLLELACGFEAPGGAGMDGRSLAAALGAGEVADATPVVCEYHAEGVYAPAAMVRRGAHKLIVCRGDPDLLYDLEADPHELANLAQEPEHEALVGDLRAELTRRLDLGEIERRVLASQRERRLVGRALAEGTPTPWDYQPPVDASMQYVRSRADLYELQRRARLEAG
jgi:choline-sulfatase